MNVEIWDILVFCRYLSGHWAWNQDNPGQIRMSLNSKIRRPMRQKPILFFHPLSSGLWQLDTERTYLKYNKYQPAVIKRGRGRDMTLTSVEIMPFAEQVVHRFLFLRIVACFSWKQHNESRESETCGQTVQQWAEIRYKSSVKVRGTAGSSDNPL